MDRVGGPVPRYGRLVGEHPLRVEELGVSDDKVTIICTEGLEPGFEFLITHIRVDRTSCFRCAELHGPS